MFSVPIGFPWYVFPLGGPFTLTYDTVGVQSLVDLQLYTAQNSSYGAIGWRKDYDGTFTSLGRFTLGGVGVPPLPKLHLKWSIVSASGSGSIGNVNFPQNTWTSQLAPGTISVQSITAFTSGSNVSYNATVLIEFSLDGGVTVEQSFTVNFDLSRTG